MVSVLPYDPRVFNGLNHFDDARKHVSWIDSVADAEFEAIVKRYGLEDVAAICLLHKHFDVQHNERLVEKQLGRSAAIEPQADADEAALCPYMWKMSTDRAGNRSLHPLEFVEASIETRQQVARLLSNEAFLLELADKVTELHAENIVGLTLVHRNRIDLGHGVVETAGETERSLVVVPLESPHALGGQEDSTETLWEFHPEGRQQKWCKSHCIRH